MWKRQQYQPTTSKFRCPPSIPYCQDLTVLRPNSTSWNTCRVRIFTNPSRLGIKAHRQACYDNVITVLADLHSVDYNAIGLGITVGRSVGMCNDSCSDCWRSSERRQRNCRRRSQVINVRVVLPQHQSRRFRKSSFGDSTGRLRRTVPIPCHWCGDFKMDNFVFHPVTLL
jgi:hypothetical protein